MDKPFNKLLPAPRDGGYSEENYWIWCGSVIKGDDGKYHMFASRWKKELGFGANWLFNSEIVRAVSDTPKGPFHYADTVFERRGREYFDGMNVHNPYIRKWDNKYYLYYFGITYGGPVPNHMDEITSERYLEVWNKKRIGVAVSDSICGPFIRKDTPLLEPRDCSFWDCTITTNPAVTILDDGKTYMIYKSREYASSKLQLGIAVSNRPDGVFERLSNLPLFNFEDENMHVEDPFLWYADGYFHLIAKDDFKNNSGGITGIWGSGFYAYSKDCLEWIIPNEPLIYNRDVLWDDGKIETMRNLERPFILFEDNKPTHIYFATGVGDAAYSLEHSWNMVIPISFE